MTMQMIGVEVHLVPLIKLLNRTPRSRKWYGLRDALADAGREREFLALLKEHVSAIEQEIEADAAERIFPIDAANHESRQSRRSDRESSGAHVED